LDGSGREAFWYLNFTRTEIEEAVHLSMNEGMIKPIKKFIYDAEPRYRISGKLLRPWLANLREFYKLVTVTMDDLWRTIRKPSTHEWLRFLYGPSDEYRLELYNIRHRRNYTPPSEDKQVKQMIIRGKDWTKKDMKQIAKDWSRLKEESLKMEKYRFPADLLPDIICPKSLLR